MARVRAAKSGVSPEEVIADWASAIPLRCLANPEEIANLVVFLASEKASYTTDATIQADEGFIKALI